MENSYIELVKKQLDDLNSEEEKFIGAADYVKEVIDNDGVIYIFGCGHSHMFSEEFFYRAGGLANVVPILYEPLMLHKGAMQSSINEKKNNYTNNFIKNYKITENDILIVISTSGRNPVPIDVGLYGKNCGCKVITISSFAYPLIETSRHNESIFLNEVGNINIDNKVTFGDAMMSKNKIPHSPSSTIIGMTILHQIISKAINASTLENLPIFKSGNISGTTNHNEQLVNKYKNKIPMLAMNLESEID